MKNSAVHINHNVKSLPSLSPSPLSRMDLSKEYNEVNILRRAYELILENSDMFFCELERSFRIERERERRESNPMI